MPTTAVQRPLGDIARRFLFTHREEDGGYKALRDFDRLEAAADALAQAIDTEDQMKARDALVAYRFARAK